MRRLRLGDLRRAWVVVFAVLVVGATSCVAHPGLPAFDASDYVGEGIAHCRGRDLDLVDGAVGPGRIARGSSTDAYAGQLLDDQVDRLDDTVSSFTAVQPPDATSRALRVDVVAALRDAQDTLGQVVVDFDAGDTVAAVAMRGALGDDIRSLEKFVVQ